MMKRLAFLMFCLAGFPLFAQTIEERLSRLEQEVRALRAENEELRRQLTAPAAAPAPPPAPAPAPAAEAVAVRAAGREAALAIGGLIQAQGEAGARPDTRYSDDNDRVFLRRARVNATGRFAEAWDFRVEVDLAGSLGASSGMRAQATDAYVTWTGNPAANVRVGQFKTPYGYEQLASDPVLPVIERSLANDRLTAGRQLGVQVGGTVGNRRVRYAVGAFNGNGINTATNDDEGFLTAARASATLLDAGGTRWDAGVNGYMSDDRNVSVAPELGFAGNAFAGERRAWGADTQFVTGPFEVWAEILRATYEPSTGDRREVTGGYLMGMYSITPKLQALARYDSFDAETLDTDTWTFGANYLVKGHDLKLQLYLLHSDFGDRVVARVQTVF